MCIIHVQHYKHPACMHKVLSRTACQIDNPLVCSRPGTVHTYKSWGTKYKCPSCVLREGRIVMRRDKRGQYQRLINHLIQVQDARLEGGDTAVNRLRDTAYLAFDLEIGLDSVGIGGDIGIEMLEDEGGNEVLRKMNQRIDRALEEEERRTRDDDEWMLKAMWYRKDTDDGPKEQRVAGSVDPRNLAPREGELSYSEKFEQCLTWLMRRTAKHEKERQEGSTSSSGMSSGSGSRTQPDERSMRDEDSPGVLPDDSISMAGDPDRTISASSVDSSSSHSGAGKGKEVDNGEYSDAYSAVERQIINEALAHEARAALSKDGDTDEQGDTIMKSPKLPRSASPSRVADPPAKRITLTFKLSPKKKEEEEEQEEHQIREGENRQGESIAESSKAREQNMLATTEEEEEEEFFLSPHRPTVWKTLPSTHQLIDRSTPRPDDFEDDEEVIDEIVSNYQDNWGDKVEVNLRKQRERQRQQSQ